MTEAIIMLMNMRGGCANVGDKVHALFRVNGRSKSKNDQRSSNELNDGAQEKNRPLRD
jgi:hypothetical protein